jgi:GTP:adenosylcobinamide-phosphate guanylyltransferase
MAPAAIDGARSYRCAAPASGISSAMARQADDARSVEALVLAGRRGGADRVARAAAVSHRALVPLAGRALIAHVLGALRGVPRVARVSVSVDDAAPFRAHPQLAGFDVAYHTAGRSPADSVRAFVSEAGSLPVLVTTADHPLLPSATIDAFLSEALATGADAVIGVVREEAVRVHAPRAKRTWLRLAGERLTGANLFLFRPPGSARVAAYWRQAEGFRKEPWRLAAVFGPLALARFAAGRLALEDALRIASKASKASIAAVRLADGLAGIDVDKPEDLALAEQLLRDRADRAS